MPRSFQYPSPNLQQARVNALRSALAELQRELVQIVQERQHLELGARRIGSRLRELERLEQVARRQEHEITQGIHAAERGASVGLPQLTRYPRLGAIRVQERSLF